MTLSIILPNYNGSRFLPKAIAAVSAQTRPVDEIIVIDDGSTDDSQKTIEAMARDVDIRVLRNGKNLGAAAAYHRGVQEAKGTHIALLAVDDLVYPGWWDASYDALLHYPQARLCLSSVRMRDRQLDFSHVRGNVAASRCFLSPQEVAESGRRGRLLVFTTGAVYHRQTLIECGSYIPELKWHSDWFALFCAAFRHGFCWIPDVLTEFNKWSSNYSADGRRSAAQVEVLRHALDLLDSQEFHDVAPLFRRSGVLGPFGWPMLHLVLRRRYRHNLSPIFFKTFVWWTAIMTGRKYLPRWAIEHGCRLRGVSA